MCTSISVFAQTSPSLLSDRKVRGQCATCMEDYCSERHPERQIKAVGHYSVNQETKKKNRSKP